MKHEIDGYIFTEVKDKKWLDNTNYIIVKIPKRGFKEGWQSISRDTKITAFLYGIFVAASAVAFCSHLHS